MEIVNIEARTFEAMLSAFRTFADRLDTLYAETFIVIEGRAHYQIGDAVIEAEAGEILTGPAEVPHKFTNLGPGRLRTIDIHHSPEWIQTNLE